jgi:hypothetical protein
VKTARSVPIKPCSEELHKNDADTRILGLSRVDGDSPNLDWGRLCVCFVWESFGEDVGQVCLSTIGIVKLVWGFP